MDTTTGYQFSLAVHQTLNETVEFEGETYPLIRVEISIRFTSLHCHQNSLKQTDAWITVSTKNTVSNKQHLVVKLYSN